jgi:hypothetical protein
MEKLRILGVDFSKVAAISGAGQVCSICKINKIPNIWIILVVWYKTVIIKSSRDHACSLHVMNTFIFNVKFYI